MRLWVFLWDYMATLILLRYRLEVKIRHPAMVYNCHNLNHKLHQLLTPSSMTAIIIRHSFHNFLICTTAVKNNTLISLFLSLYLFFFSLSYPQTGQKFNKQAEIKDLRIGWDFRMHWMLQLHLRRVIQKQITLSNGTESSVYFTAFTILIQDACR